MKTAVARIESIPTEVLRIMMEKLSVADLVALGLTSQLMWMQASAVLAAHFAAVAAH